MKDNGYSRADPPPSAGGWGKIGVSRRDFLKRAAALSAGAAATTLGASLGITPRSFAGSLVPRHVPPIDLAVVTGDEPARNCLTAIDALGGFEKFVRSGDKVVVKPNPVGTSLPERGINTHPAMVEAVVRECKKAGAREVLVVSNDELRSFQGNGIAAAVERAGGVVRTLQDRDRFRVVTVPRGRILQRVDIAEDVLDCDLFINMPIAKHHAGSRFTGSLKNLMGVNWDRLYFHSTDLHQCIAEMSTVIRHDLVIMDANHVLLTNGPVGPGQVLNARQVIAGVDPVAVDSYAVSYLKLEPKDVGHIRAAWELGVGEMDRTALRVRELQA
jgi:uncharacterized protein (DUF362 family)